MVPFVEGNFRAATGAQKRGIGGSSFGAIVSLYAGWTRPTVFGAVLAMSQAPGVYDFAGLVASSPGGKKALRVYLDSGTVDPFPLVKFSVVGLRLLCWLSWELTDGS